MRRALPAHGLGSILPAMANAVLTMHFMDGTKLAVRYPKLTGPDATTVAAAVKRAIDAEKVVVEIEFYMTTMGARNFPFQDLTAIVKRDWILAFCKALMARDLKVTWQFPSGTRCEVFDDEGVLQVAMYYPHSRQKADGVTNIDVSEPRINNIRVAGLMHQPENGSSITMAGPMGMVKLFVRTGVQVVRDVYAAYQARLDELGMSGRTLAVAIVHHANYKINKLKEKHLQNEGIVLPMPWLVSDFGNVSAASNMIAFLRELPEMRPFDHILIDGSIRPVD